MRKKVLYAAIAFVVVMIAIQFIPVNRTNPPANPANSFEALAHPSPEVVAVVNRACKNCHSNETVWPPYSKVAPASWLVAQDVHEGRAHVNFSEWNRLSSQRASRRMEEMCDETREGKMPPSQYLLLHPEAKLSEADVSVLCSASADEQQ